MKHEVPNVQIQSLPSLVLSSDPTLKTLPPLGEIVKLKWPTYSGVHSLFESWKHHFLAVLCASELAALFDRISDNLINYGDVTEDDVFFKYEDQLYSRIISSLPTSNAFIEAAEYRSRGLALWHALLEDNNSIGSTFNTNILLPAFYSLERSTGESVDSYWNRFQNHLRKILRDPSVKLEKDHIRRQFLTSLGPDCEFLGSDVENESLDGKWLSYSDEQLKAELRKIQQK